MKFTVYQDSNGGWRWRLRAKNGRIVADSAEGYRSRRHCAGMCKRINPAFRVVCEGPYISP